jgi:tRNA threonylcarbamoyladenosine biosynthesis protein TsaE
MELSLRAGTADDMREVGAAIAGLLRADDVVVLTGELGAGKTTLVQGIARGLGAEEHVASPTFTLVREYVSGRLPVAHVDVYRLERMQDVVDLALDELAGDDAVLLVEWGDAIEALLPADRLRIELVTEDDSEARRLTVSTEGTVWGGRAGDLARALAPWETLE